MTSAPELELLRSRMFDGLTADERHAWLAAARAREFARGAVVARQGEPAEELFLVASGFLKVVQGTADGHELIVRFAGPGDPFGGVTVLDSAAYPVTALAAQATRLLGWTASGVKGLIERTPQVRANIMREMAAHMTDALTRVHELANKRVSQRLAHALLRLAQQCGRPGAAGAVVLMQSLTRQELADLTGTTLYTVSRTLSQWTSEGILGAEGRRLVIRDLAGLERLAR
jgi:CRP-like cAMP-binding protein